MTITKEQFLEYRAARRGSGNPERMTNPVWLEIIEQVWSAYQASQHYGAETGCQIAAGWCFDRFGMSEVTLPDGRRVHIAGEHEDDYDPDFFIYNDVVVVDPDGSTEIYGYAREIFPPTDFHSSTLVGDDIVFVGNLGYPEDRKPETTQVGRLEIGTWEIEMLSTFGDAPAWLHEHAARLDGNGIRVSGGRAWTGEVLHDNVDDWFLDLDSRVWTRRTRRPHEEWSVFRSDGKGVDMIALWQERSKLEMASWGFDLGDPSPLDSELPSEVSALLAEHQRNTKESLGLSDAPLDVEAYDQLYTVPFEARRRDDDELEHPVMAEYELGEAEVGSTKIVLECGLRSLDVKIRGALDHAQRDALLEHITTTLGQIIRKPCQAVRRAGSTPRSPDT